MANILITGLAGFVGSRTAEYFLDQGHHVIGLVRDLNNKTRPEIQARCSIIRGDILDKELLRAILSKYEVDYVIHLAAQPIVRICDNDPYTAYMTNIVGTLNILEACRTLRKQPKKIIAMTSDKAYGPHANLPYKENSELVVADTYCTSKGCQDMIARSYAKTYNLPVVVVRAGNIYGPGDLNLSRLIPNSILQLLDEKSPMLYSGVSNFIREFLYVDSIANAYDILLQKGVPGEAYNVGGSKPQKILDVISLIRDKIDPSIPLNIVDREFYEIPEQYLDASKLKALGWQGSIDLSEGLDNTIQWFQNRKNATHH